MTIKGFLWWAGDPNASTASGSSSTSGQGTKILHVTWCTKKKKKVTLTPWLEEGGI